MSCALAVMPEMQSRFAGTTVGDKAARMLKQLRDDLTKFAAKYPNTEAAKKAQALLATL